MKKIFSILFMTTFLFTACSSNDGERGPQGPEGPQGLPGEDGAGIQGTAIDLEPIDFNTDNNYEILFDFNQNGYNVKESDAILVYLKVGEDGEDEGLPVNIYKPLPQTYYIDNEEVQYNYSFTYFDVLIYLEGTVEFDELDPAFTEDQIFRIVIVPATFAEDTGIDTSNINAVMNALDLKESDVKKVKMTK